MSTFRPLKFLPTEDKSSRSMFWIIAVMLFLCTLVLMIGLVMFNAGTRWSTDLEGEITVQIVADGPQQVDAETEAALIFLNATPGIESAEAISDAQIAALLEPFLGTGNLRDDLPIPALIRVKLSAGSSVSTEALSTGLKSVAPHASVDDHGNWLAGVLRLANIIRYSVVLGVVLMVATTATIIVFGTRARMAIHEKFIELVHLIGASDHIIEEEFRYHFLDYGLRGGAAGVGAALAVGTILWLSVSGSEWLNLENIGLTPIQWLLFALIPLLSGATAMISAGITVRRALRRML